MKKKLSALIGLAIFSIAGANAASVSQIYTSALKNDPVIQEAASTMNATKQGFVQARGELLPQINLVGSYGSSRFVNVGSDLFYTDTLQQNQAWSVGVDVTQTIFNLAAWRSLGLAKQSSKEAELSFAYTKQEVIFTVAQEYLEALQDLANLQSIQVEAKALKSELATTQAEYKAGTSTLSDVAQAEAQYDNVLAQEISYRSTLRNQLQSLYVITGENVTSLNSLNSKLFSPYQITSFQPYVKKALQNNLSLIVAETEAAYNKAKVSVDRGNYYPKISFVGSITNTNSDTNGTVNPEGREGLEDLSLQVQASMPIFNGGVLASETIQQNDTYIASLQSVVNTKRTLVETVTTDINNINSSYSSIMANKQYVISANTAYQATLAGYKAGTETMTDLLLSEESKYSAARQLIDAKYDYLINQFSLALADGSINSTYINQLDYLLDTPEYLGQF